MMFYPLLHRFNKIIFTAIGFSLIFNCGSTEVPPEELSEEESITSIPEAELGEVNCWDHYQTTEYEIFQSAEALGRIRSFSEKEGIVYVYHFSSSPNTKLKGISVNEPINIPTFGFDEMAAQWAFIQQLVITDFPDFPLDWKYLGVGGPIYQPSYEKKRETNVWETSFFNSKNQIQIIQIFTTPINHSPVDKRIFFPPCLSKNQSNAFLTTGDLDHILNQCAKQFTDSKTLTSCFSEGIKFNCGQANSTKKNQGICQEKAFSLFAAQQGNIY